MDNYLNIRNDLNSQNFLFLINETQKEIYNGYLVLFNGKKQRTFKHVLLKIEKNNIMAKGNDK